MIAAMPYVDSLHAPMAAPAVLKSALTAAGITAIAMDLNIEVLLKVKTNPNKDLLEDFFLNQNINDAAVELISKCVFYCANKIAQHQPTVIALSLLTYECQTFTAWTCLVLRQLCPFAKIVIGGPGVKTHIASFNDGFRENLKSRNLIDDWITGDGENSLVEYIKGNNQFPGINNDDWLPIKDFDIMPYPDYSDYNFFMYSQSFMPVVDAKGCVRNCEFCDVIEYWEKFQSRSANKIFDEMLFQMNQYNFKDFDFRSSLSNGNLKEFKKLLALMYDYNQTRYRVEQLSWNASFIVRPKSQHPESMWEQMGATNATLSIGVESVVPHVRKNLGKYFENVDIDYHLEMAKKYNVKIIMMIITGYPTETKEDYDYTKQWFRDRQNYANNPVVRLMLSPANVLPGTGLSRNATEIGIENSQSRINWYNTKTKISVDERLQYHQQLIDICKNECKFNLNAY